MAVLENRAAPQAPIARFITPRVRVRPICHSVITRIRLAMSASDSVESVSRNRTWKLPGRRRAVPGELARHAHDHHRVSRCAEAVRVHRRERGRERGRRAAEARDARHERMRRSQSGPRAPSSTTRSSAPLTVTTQCCACANAAPASAASSAESVLSTPFVACASPAMARNLGRVAARQSTGGASSQSRCTVECGTPSRRRRPGRARSGCRESALAGRPAPLLPPTRGRACRC